MTTAKDDADEHVVVRPVGASPGRDAEFTAFVLNHRATLLRAAWLLLSEADVADDLDVSIGTVRSTASRALADLRVALGSRYADLEGGAR